MSVCWQVVIKQCNKFDAKIKGQVLDEMVLMKIASCMVGGGGGDAVGGGGWSIIYGKVVQLN